LEQKHGAKTVRGWLGATCVLAVACLYFFPVAGLAQDSSSAASDTVPARTGGTKAASPAAHAKAASGSKASSSSMKAHPASHPAAGQHSKSSTAVAAHNNKAKYASARKNSKKKPRGQQKIEAERAQAIQEALIREHYMSGEPTGTWNQSSEDAMRRYQADHGWQSKTVPDSRALISLGLGPSHDHLLNPESAMTTGPNISHAAAPVSSSSQSPLSHSAEPGAHMSTNPTPAADPAHATASDHDAPSPQ
jgi:putative peptidoglycan binding protein